MSEDRCTCSGFVLQYEGSCQCGYEAAKNVKALRKEKEFISYWQRRCEAAEKYIKASLRLYASQCHFEEYKDWLKVVEAHHAHAPEEGSMYKVGEKVYIEATNGMCTGGEDVVTDIVTKYDEDTGKPYKVICCGKHHFRAATGEPITPPWAYRLVKM